MEKTLMGNVVPEIQYAERRGEGRERWRRRYGGRNRERRQWIGRLVGGKKGRKMMVGGKRKASREETKRRL